MRRFFIIGLLIIGTLQLSAGPNLDSLNQVLNQSPEDTSKVLLYRALTSHYINNSEDTAIVFAEKGMALARKLNYTKGLIECLNEAGNFYERKTNYEKAIELYQEAIDSCKATNYQEGIAILINNIAIIALRKGDYQKAIEQYFEALKVEEKLGNQKGIAESYNNIGIVYYYQRDLDKTLEYFEKAIAIDEALGDSDVLKKGYNNIGALYNYQKKYTKAIEFYRRAYQLSLALNDRQEQAANLNNIAVAFHGMQQQDSALYYHEKSIQINRALENYRGLAYGHHTFAAIHKDRGDYETAEAFYLKSLEVSKKHELNEVKSENYKALAALYEAKKAFEKANEYLYLHLSTKDSLFNEERTQAIAEMESKYQNEKKAKEILEQQAKIDNQQLEIKQKNLQLISFAAVGIILFLLAILLVNYQRQKNKRLQQESELRAAKAKIETQEKLQDQRMRISRDLHDNIGAQLTFIISSIDNLKYGFQLNNERLVNKLKSISQFTSSTIRELRDTIWAMNKGSISFEDLQQRIQAFLSSAQEASHQTNFRFHLDERLEQDAAFSAVKGMAIYRIIQEAVNNALKHAQAQKIEVSVQKNTAGITFMIQDNGTGFDPETANKSHGLYNMQKRAKEINGSLEFQSQAGKGTQIQLQVPKT